MNLWIPTLGDSFILEEPWTFTLVNETRNISLFGKERKKLVEWKPRSYRVSSSTPMEPDYYTNRYSWETRRNVVVTPAPDTTGEYPNGAKWKMHNYKIEDEISVFAPLPDKEFTLPAGIALYIERIYIRKGNKDYDSVTFRTGECEDKTLSRKRFFARLEDVNKIKYIDPIRNIQKEK